MLDTHTRSGEKKKLLSVVKINVSGCNLQSETRLSLSLSLSLSRSFSLARVAYSSYRIRANNVDRCFIAYRYVVTIRFCRGERLRVKYTRGLARMKGGGGGRGKGFLPGGIAWCAAREFSRSGRKQLRASRAERDE